MNIKCIAHAAYKITDMEKSLKFYCEGLGFKKKFELQDEQGRPWIQYLEIVPEQFIELFYDYDVLAAEKKDNNHIGYLHLSIEVTDLIKFKKDSEDNGITFDGEIGMESDNTYQLWVTDPDGNRIEFMEYTKASLQIAK